MIAGGLGAGRLGLNALAGFYSSWGGTNGLEIPLSQGLKLISLGFFDGPYTPVDVKEKRVRKPEPGVVTRSEQWVYYQIPNFFYFDTLYFDEEPEETYQRPLIFDAIAKIPSMKGPPCLDFHDIF
ncbi:MAG: hypothetical protein COY38_03900 [Candidatus Aenigmarchaeota archaeon CG_4_10_14_0_8_um_filter_37_24]|nr:hypothetical protein [Candidatus Aenigmarchaeota archaeon]OIN86571.1 MAG: hypothetical protein AUJ50_03740 [Candidatus Aenigmarchaeota archaeon CG1_02_38_14]PIV69392.1 MAG: hypothetical protein COS07_00880 [Candidatus Aenigmarchaeota archaeon CG01_land_8_20_14_3_00_37_9]PIW41706.1 MAG: hypothetical protein COW21_00425 [Candidatus Aenigmarchaeota archaeon CG15_BIG_FIL_POST_REV_8_21_14_020_37_27]PIX50547.1 MAG: hypothetical protein COZ52_03475 [Candidatus Aenigmarchaeota archaeon CG_4_8_14_3_u